MDKDRWKIAESAANWECSWDENERFQLRYFRSLPIVEKIKAVEEMCDFVEFFAEKARKRRQR